jgi:hypothetical protein
MSRHFVHLFTTFPNQSAESIQNSQETPQLPIGNLVKK